MTPHDGHAAPRPQPFANGDRISDGMGTVYVMSHVTSHSHTLRLAIPKVRGKAARAAGKLERRRQRARIARSRASSPSPETR